MNIELLKHAQEEYDKGTPVMSDEAFDTLTDSESQFKLTEDTYTVKHNHYMGSISKVHSEEKLLDVVGNGWVAQPKFDGISCELILENGYIKSISTRGNGEYGKDLGHLLSCGFLEGVVWNPELESVYSELTFVSDNTSQKDRNIVAGIANKSDVSQDEINSLQLNVFKVYYKNNIIVPYTELERVYLCNSKQVVPSKTYVTLEPHNIKVLQEMFDQDYPKVKRDGIVFIVTGKQVVLS